MLPEPFASVKSGMSDAQRPTGSVAGLFVVLDDEKADREMVLGWSGNVKIPDPMKRVGVLLSVIKRTISLKVNEASLCSS